MIAPLPDRWAADYWLREAPRKNESLGAMNHSIGTTMADDFDRSREN